MSLKRTKKTTEYDLTTGEQLRAHIEETYYSNPKKTPFMATFLAPTIKFTQLTAILPVNVFFALCRRATHNTNEVILTKLEKERIAAELNKNDSSPINKAIIILTELDFIIKIGNNHFIINPEMFFKGDFANISAVKNVIGDIRLKKSKEALAKV